MSVSRSTVVFYVTDVQKSQAFYEALFSASPVHRSDEFALYALHQSLSFGIWQQFAVIPPLTSSTGTQGELCLFVDDLNEFQAMYQHCRTIGVPVIQPPAEMDFATAFTVADPDGYRIRYAIATAE